MQGFVVWMAFQVTIVLGCYCMYVQVAVILLCCVLRTSCVLVTQSMGFSVEESEAAARKHTVMAHAIDDLLAGKGTITLFVCRCVTSGKW